MRSKIFSEQSTLHRMKLAPAPFELIKSGKKTVELRLYDEKRKELRAGDIIEFTNTHTGETLTTMVLKLHIFGNFEELYRTLPLLNCGYTEENVTCATPHDMEKYYSPEQQKQYGVVGIELCLSENVTENSDL